MDELEIIARMKRGAFIAFTPATGFWLDCGWSYYYVGSKIVFKLLRENIIYCHDGMSSEEFKVQYVLGTPSNKICFDLKIEKTGGINETTN